jgi:transcriptional regulator with XRE-family HTH domain
MDKKAFGAWVSMRRNSRRLSQTELAVMVDVTPGQISRIESGERGASSELIDKLARILHSPLDEAYRAADIFPPIPAKAEKRRALDHIADQMPEEDLDRYIEIGEALLSASRQQGGTKGAKAKRSTNLGTG